LENIPTKLLFFVVANFDASSVPDAESPLIQMVACAGSTAKTF